MDADEREGLRAADDGERTATEQRILRALAALDECMKPNDNAAGEWATKPTVGGVDWLLLGPRYASRSARTVVGTIELDSFPDENPKRAQRVAEAIVSIINDTRRLLRRPHPGADMSETRITLSTVFGRAVHEVHKWENVMPDFDRAAAVGHLEILDRYGCKDMARGYRAALAEIDRLAAERDRLRAALLGVKTGTNQWGGPCWCRTAAGLYCVGQPQCEAATAALKEAP